MMRVFGNGQYGFYAFKRIFCDVHTRRSKADNLVLLDYFSCEGVNRAVTALYHINVKIDTQAVVRHNNFMQVTSKKCDLFPFPPRNASKEKDDAREMPKDSSNLQTQALSSKIK